MHAFSMFKSSSECEYCGVSFQNLRALLALPELADKCVVPSAVPRLEILAFLVIVQLSAANSNGIHQKC